MDSVREEVMALMLDGMQKTASFCASLCAERVVAARRELQRRWADERRELERSLYGGGGGDFGTSMATPVATGLLPFAPPRPESVASLGGASPRGAASFLGGPPSESYDASFIDAYDAVQTLEERTNMAARAMDLLDEALQAATGPGVCGAASQLARGSRPSSAALSARSGAGGRLGAAAIGESSAVGSSREPVALPAALPAALQTAEVASPSSADSSSTPTVGGFSAVWEATAAAAAATATAGGLPPQEPREASSLGGALSPTAATSERRLPSPVGGDDEGQPLPTLAELAAGVALPTFEHRDQGGRAMLRERSVASSGYASVAAADLHGA